MSTGKKLLRSRSDRGVAGICGGIGDYFDVDPALVRLVYMLLTFFSAGFPGLMIYLVLWLVMPNAKGELRTEHSFCYQWKVGESKADAVVESPGRFATAPAISGDTITLVPRVRADEGVYYGITAYSLTDNLRTIVDQLVLPVSVRPMNAVRSETLIAPRASSRLKVCEHFNT